MAVPATVPADFDPLRVRDYGGVDDAGQGGNLVHEDITTLFDAAKSQDKTGRITILVVPDMRDTTGKAVIPRYTSPTHSSYYNTAIVSLKK